MRWFSFVILVLMALLVQMTVCRPLGLGPQRVMPDLLGLLVIVIAFRGPGAQAMVGCWLLGLAKDLSSDAVLGSYAFCFGLLAMFIVWLREMIYGENALVLMLLTFAGCLLVEHMVWTIAVVKGDIGGDSYSGTLVAVMFSALLTAALAPYANWLIVKLHRQLGLPAKRRYDR